MLYALNLYNDQSQLFLKKTEKKKNNFETHKEIGIYVRKWDEGTVNRNSLQGAQT